MADVEGEPPFFSAAAWVELGPQHRPRRKFRFRTPDVIVLLTSDGDERAYLYYMERNGETINDVLLPGHEEAMESTALDFGVVSSDWIPGPWPVREVWSVLVWTADEGPVISKPPTRRKTKRQGLPRADS